MYIYTYIHIYICMYTYIYIYTHTNTYIYISIDIYKRTCTAPLHCSRYLWQQHDTSAATRRFACACRCVSVFVSAVTPVTVSPRACRCASAAAPKSASEAVCGSSHAEQAPTALSSAERYGRPACASDGCRGACASPDMSAAWRG